MNLNELLKKMSEIPDISNVGERKYDDIEEKIRKEELKKLELENAAREGENAGDSQDRTQRKEFAERIFSFVSLYMFFVCLIVFLCVHKLSSFQLSDTVLVTLLGTTTANVIGILIIVVTYLFSRKKK